MNPAIDVVNMRTLWSSNALAVFALMVVGCTSSSQNDASGSSGGAAGGGASGAGGGATDAGGGDDAVSCRASIQDFCGSLTTDYCTPSWSGVAASSPGCSKGVLLGTVVYVCGSYNVRQSVNVDVGKQSFYDSATGVLVAVWNIGMGGSYCLGGPPSFSPPSCPDLVCPDLGADGGGND
jgi:hypothetical protein